MTIWPLDDNSGPGTTRCPSDTAGAGEAGAKEEAGGGRPGSPEATS